MQFTVELPDNLVSQVIPAGHDPSRAAVEGLAVEAYRAHRITEHELATLLDMDRYELDGFLKQREIWLEYSPDQIQRELETSQRLWLKRREELLNASESLPK